MPRKKQTPKFIPPEWTQIIRYKFLNYGRLSNAEPFSSLITEVLQGSLTVQQWAERYGFVGTWIQAWAAKAINVWRLPVDSVTGLGLLADEKYRLPLPDDGHTDADVFKFNISEVPRSKFALGVIRGGGCRFDETGLSDLELFRRQKHAALDRAIDVYLANKATVVFESENAVPPKRAGREVIIPKNLDLLLQKAAAYYFGTMSTADIAGHKGFVTDRTNAHRQVKRALMLLGLPTRATGHKRVHTRPSKPPH